MARNYYLMNVLCQQNYSIGMAELYDYTIIPFLKFIGCQHIIATSAMPLKSIYYYYLGVLPEIKNNIPAIADIPINEQRRRGFANCHDQEISDMKKNIKIMDKIYKNISKNIGYYEKTNFEYLIQNDINFIFVNNQPFMDFQIQLNQQKIVNIGGITFPFNNMELNEQELEYFNEAMQNGKRVILVSFGTIVSGRNLTNEQIENIIAIFNDLQQYLFILKIEAEYINQNYNNILRVDFMNQTAILARPETVLFISHCGMNSALEAVKYGKPLICIPFMFDQYYISKALATHRVAIVLDKNNDTFEDLHNKIVFAQRRSEHMLALQEVMNRIDPAQLFLEKIYQLIN